MKKFISDLLARRFVWLLLGIATLPTVRFVHSLIRPTAKSAMGLVGFYEENKSLYTILGDHTYSLKFPGDREDFERFAKRVGLGDHRESETEYREEDPQGQWRWGVIFDKTDKLRSIQFYSESN